MEYNITNPYTEQMCLDEASHLQYQHHITHVLLGHGCPHDIDFGQFQRGGGSGGGGGGGDQLRRPGRVMLTPEQLRALIAKLGACSGVTTIDLGGEGKQNVWLRCLLCCRLRDA